MPSLAHTLPAHSLTTVLPDVGAPASLLFLALVGLLIFAGGLVAMVMTRRS
ncbi:hypothetical protein [Nocardioides aequoreus]|uniref:hypothetical protein n=1 Tax=Nocardioides aequoreus TaxID=397278 RepID=UPI00146FDCC9|nr:hypothetical protein [Nocardioides aequoreus]